MNKNVFLIFACHEYVADLLLEEDGRGTFSLDTS